jgi:Cu+-exporting ATPase
MPDVATLCYHCGIPADGLAGGIRHDGKLFCCAGCRAVYDILSKNRLCEYYGFQESPGVTPSVRRSSQYEYLDDPRVISRLVEYSSSAVSVVSFHIPQIHCSSCIWLLENLHKLDNGILFSRADFLKKSLLVRFSRLNTSLRRVVELLASLGYEPELTLGSSGAMARARPERSFYLKIGVAAFSFGNVMLFSLPAYFAASGTDLESRKLFGFINLLLALPVVFYSSSVFFSSAVQGLRRKTVTIELPIALGIAIAFTRSAAEVLLNLGPGYFDSLCGLVFFLLLGRLFQNKTYESLNFDRTYQAYFPLAVVVRRNGRETTVPVTVVRPGDRMVIRNNEIIPADAVVMRGAASVNYSFVTGESDILLKQPGDIVYAGGRQVGGAVELEAVKGPSQSSFTQLWNTFDAGGRSTARLLTLSGTVGKYFTAGLLLVSLGTAVAWWHINPGRILETVTAVLIVACPCALALAAPFAFGTAMRIFGRNGLFLKNAGVVESLATVTAVVFDKTGTITRTDHSDVSFSGGALTEEERLMVASLARNSTHPLSRSITAFLSVTGFREVEQVEEQEGAGIQGRLDGRQVKLGSAVFTGVSASSPDPEERRTRVYASVDGRVLGAFEFQNVYRDGLSGVLSTLASGHAVSVLSGDGTGERGRLISLYPGFDTMLFNQQPADKLTYIRSLQEQHGKKVLMVGDGLNDAGALWQSDVGMSVAEDVNAFTPACDAILRASSFGLLDRFVQFASSATHVVYLSFGISIMYNIAGLYFAVTGVLSPLLAAVLMPVSSISVVAFSTLATRFLARRKGLL